MSEHIHTRRVRTLHTLKALQQKAGRDEALFRPSNAKTWLNCPGHIRLAAGAAPGRSSQYAKEGTAAHVVLAEALRGARQPEEWTDRMVQLDADGIEGWFVDEEMIESIDFCLGHIRSLIEPGVLVFVEHRMSLGLLDPDDPILAENRGTGDVVLVNPTRRRLTIFDLKYGRGIPVPADAPQLRNYALMGLLNFAAPPGGWQDIQLIVGQPRAEDESQRLKIVTFDPSTLMAFAGTLYGAMLHALDPDPPLQPDPAGAHMTGSWCYYCAARAHCPALRNAAVAIGIEAFAAVPLTPVTITTSMPKDPLPQVAIAPAGREHGTDAEGVYHLKHPTDLTPEQIAAILDRRAAWDTWIKAVEERAAALLGAGTRIPGWILAARTGKRRYNPDIEPLDIAKAAARLGLPMAQAYTEPKLKSPKQLEIALTPGVPLEAVEAQLQLDKRDPGLRLIFRPPGAPTLVRADTPKEALPGAFTPLPKG